MAKNILEIVDRIKKLKGIKKDSQVAMALKMTSTALYNHKIRQSIPYEALSTFCEENNVSLDWLLTGEGKMKMEKEEPLMVAEKTAIYGKEENYIFIPQVSGKISAGGGLVPDNTVELRLAFKREWIQRHGEPQNMSLIRVSGDSMEPTLFSGDIVLVDHNRNYIDPQGGIYAIAMDDVIMIKRLQVIYPSKKIWITSDNPRYKPLEAGPEQIVVNGKVIWFGRETEK